MLATTDHIDVLNGLVAIGHSMFDRVHLYRGYAYATDGAYVVRHKTDERGKKESAVFFRGAPWRLFNKVNEDDWRIYSHGHEWCMAGDGQRMLIDIDGEQFDAMRFLKLYTSLCQPKMAIVWRGAKKKSEPSFRVMLLLSYGFEGILLPCENRTNIVRRMLLDEDEQ